MHKLCSESLSPGKVFLHKRSSSFSSNLTDAVFGCGVWDFFFFFLTQVSILCYPVSWCAVAGSNGRWGREIKERTHNSYHALIFSCSERVPFVLNSQAEVEILSYVLRISRYLSRHGIFAFPLCESFVIIA